MVGFSFFSGERKALIIGIANACLGALRASSIPLTKREPYNKCGIVSNGNDFD